MGTMMSADMGMWALWGVMALGLLVVMIAATSWWRGRSSIGSDSDMTSAGATASKGAPRSSTRNNYMITNSEASHASWGLWPWALISALVLGALGWLVWNSSLDLSAGSFKWILWSLLAMAGLFSFLGIAQMSRRHPMVDEKRGSPRGLGFLTLLSGLVLGLASWFVWQPKVAGFGGLHTQISGLETRNADLQGEYDGLNTRLISRDTLIKRLRGDAETSALKYTGLKKDAETDRNNNVNELERLNGVITELTKGRSLMSAENVRLKDLLGNNNSSNDDISKLAANIKTLREDNKRLNGLLTNSNNDGKENGKEIARFMTVVSGLNKHNGNLTTENARMQKLLGTYKNDADVQHAKISSLEADLAALRNKPAVVRSVAQPQSDTPLTMIHNYNEDETLIGLTSSDYNIVKAGGQEVVEGKSGQFYYVDLKNPANGRAYKFATASYSSVKNQKRFKKSLDRAIADIKGAFDGKRAYQLYVRGKASAGRYSGKMAKGYEYTDIKVLERDANGSYGTSLVDRQYKSTISNDDLPNLRGAYLQEYIGKNYDIAKPIILDGKVSKSKAKKKQALSVILFVEN